MSSSSSGQSGVATFGQLAAVADRHRSEVHEALRRPDIAVQASRPGSITELGRLAQVLTRYTDRIAHGFGLPSDDGASTRDIARQAGASLRHATAYLDRPTSDAEQDTSLAQNLRASAAALGCGLDLLFTHLPSPESSRQPTSVASVISAPDTAGQLFRLISDHAATAGQLALRTGPTPRPAGQFLLRAAALTGMAAHNHETGLQAVSLPKIPDRIRPETHEDRDQLLAGIDTSVRRLDATQAESSVTTWRYLARAATITHELDHRLVCLLRLRLETLEGSQAADQLWPVIKTMSLMSRRWRSIARTWNELTAGLRDPEIGPARDASDLVLRLGRLSRTDPTWKPGHRTPPTATDPALLAPALSDVARIGLTVITTLGACNQIAAQHRHAINDLARALSIHNIKPERAYVGPRNHGSPVEIAKLRHNYPANYADGREAVARLSGFFGEIAPALDPQMTLALRSAALPSPSSLASADCPLPLLADGAFHMGPPPPTPIHQPADPRRPSPRL
ncbi:hypothetical protein [Actinomadura oligospora]|uniref:hypothetical protein n=1 Tax=Actinomadura oligospora TaxID=111804 RepID=UPI0012F746E7|nr:hypothetical protein [Actinomadura oligospora]